MNNSRLVPSDLTSSAISCSAAPKLLSTYWLTSPTSSPTLQLPSATYGQSADTDDEQQRFHQQRLFYSHNSTSLKTAPHTSAQSTAVQSIVQPSSKIISIARTDPNGESMVVTRRCHDGHLDVRVVYSRKFILAASASPYALLPPPNFREMVLNMMEIVPKFPKSYYNQIRQQIARNNFEQTHNYTSLSHN